LKKLQADQITDRDQLITQLEDLMGRIKEYDETCFELELKISRLEEENEHLHIQRTQLLKEIQEKQQQLVVSEDLLSNSVTRKQKICFVSSNASERKATRLNAITPHNKYSFSKMLLLVSVVNVVCALFTI
jgi:predicted nuclease with TOPRIM domain